NDFVDAVDPTKVKSEYMFDGECGYTFSTSKFRVGINGYLMQYKDQLVITGALNDVGAPVRVNVPKSYRRGLELELGMKLPLGFFTEGNVTWSRNRIERFDEVIYEYTDTSVTEIKNAYTDSPIAFSPAWIGAAQLGWRYEPKSTGRLKYVELAWALKHVGQQYMDNTGLFDRMLADYFVNDARASMEFSAFDLVFGFDLWVNNALNKAYISNGYTYSYIYGDLITERFYYPQALRNFMIALRVKF
ncbi:MAG: hypothetical protein ACKO7B_19995, partial [Flavobacteriales bacterium]